MPDEPMVNLYHDRYHPLLDIKSGKWSSDLKGIYGGVLGTTFINAKVGGQIRAGYNIPEGSLPGEIISKASKSKTGILEKGFLYLKAEDDELLVLHNATLGDSFFREREAGQERDLENFVNCYDFGVVAGYDKLSVSFLFCFRTNEFEGETDGGMDYGLLRLEYCNHF